MASVVPQLVRVGRIELAESVLAVTEIDLALLPQPDPVAAAPDGTAWSAERIRLRIDLLQPFRLLLDAPGAQKVLLPDGDRVLFTTTRQHLDLPLTQAGAPGEFGLAATDIVLPPAGHAPFGPSIAALSAEGRISQAGGLANAGGATVVRQWRDRGGTLDLRDFALLWGALHISGHAMLALDDRLQPQGDGTVSIAGFAEAIAQLAASGQIPRPMAALASGLLGVVSGGTGTAEVPFQLRSGRLFVRQLPLLSVPEVIWPIH